MYFQQWHTLKYIHVKKVTYSITFRWSNSKTGQTTKQFSCFFFKFFLSLNNCIMGANGMKLHVINSKKEIMHHLHMLDMSMHKFTSQWGVKMDGDSRPAADHGSSFNRNTAESSLSKTEIWTQEHKTNSGNQMKKNQTQSEETQSQRQNIHAATIGWNCT